MSGWNKSNYQANKAELLLEYQTQNVTDEVKHTMSAHTQASDAERQDVVTAGEQHIGRLEDWANAQYNTAAEEFRAQRYESLKYRSMVAQYEFGGGLPEANA